MDLSPTLPTLPDPDKQGMEMDFRQPEVVIITNYLLTGMDYGKFRPRNPCFGDRRMQQTCCWCGATLITIIGNGNGLCATEKATRMRWNGASKFPPNYLILILPIQSIFLISVEVFDSNQSRGCKMTHKSQAISGSSGKDIIVSWLLFPSLTVTQFFMT